MRATSTPFQVMVEGVEQTYHFALKIALPGGILPNATVAVSKLSTESQMTTDLPDGTRLLEGYPAASATFTLAGLVDKSDESKTAAWLFGPYSTTSPLYRQDAFRCPVTVDLGLLPDGAGGVAELVRKFTGYVDSYTVNTDGSVDFSCVDLRSDMRGVTSLPSVVTAPPYNAGLTNEFALDALFRASKGASSWPAQRAGCVFAAGMRASTWAEAGFLDTTLSQAAPVFTPSGVNGTGLVSISTSVGVFDNPTYRTADIVGGDFTIELDIASLPTLGTAPSVDVGKLAYSIDLQTGQAVKNTAIGFDYFTLVVGRSVISVTRNFQGPVGAGNESDTYFWNRALGDGPHRVTAHISMAHASTTWSVTLRCDDNTNASGSRTVTYQRSITSSRNVTVSPNGTAVSGVMIHNEASDLSVYPFAPKALFDPSLNALQVVPAVDGDPFQVIQQIAASELGFAGFDESGIFRFYNRTRLRGSASVRTITSRTSLASLGIESTAASVVNRAQIGYTPWKFANQATTIYSIATAKKIPARTSLPIIVNLDTAVYNPDTALVKLPNGSTNTTDSFYRASIDKAGTTEHPGLSFQVVQSNPSKITITVTNATSQDAWLVSPSNYTDLAVGTPVLRLGGFLVTPDTELTADYQYPPIAGGGAAASRFGEVPFTMTGNPWVQDDDDANALAQDIVNQSSQPIPNLTGVNIVPDPRLQLADRVRIQDPDVTGVDEYAQIFSITTSLSANDDGTADYSMSIDARTITKPGAWILGVTGRSELGVTTYI